jgi:hypothetical protein
LEVPGAHLFSRNAVDGRADIREPKIAKLDEFDNGVSQDVTLDQMSCTGLSQTWEGAV